MSLPVGRYAVTCSEMGLSQGPFPTGIHNRDMWCDLDLGELGLEEIHAKAWPEQTLVALSPPCCPCKWLGLLFTSFLPDPEHIHEINRNTKEST